MLFNTGEAFKNIKKEVLENYNLHTIISLPAGVFLPYSGVKTNIIFFDKIGSTRDIWYYEINLGRTLTKNKPITYNDVKDIAELQKTRAITPNSWIVKVEDIKDYDLSAKNPNKAVEEALPSPSEILEKIEERNQKIDELTKTLSQIIK